MRRALFWRILSTSSSVASFETLHANAQSSLSDRFWKAAYSVISTVSDPNAKITIWRLKRPISFSLIEPTRAADVESLIGDAVLPATVDSACIERQLKKLTGAAAAPTTESNLDTLIAAAEVAYLKEKSLSQEDLRVYKDYRDKYAAEKKRLSGLPKDQADAESYKLEEINANWDIFGKRQDFRELEDRILKLSKTPESIDVTALRAEIYEGDSEKLRYRPPIRLMAFLTKGAVKEMQEAVRNRSSLE